MKKVGRKGEVVDVSDGYAQNVLIRGGLAEVATSDKLKRLQGERASAAEKKSYEESLLRQSVKALHGNVLTITAHANEAGTLFTTLRIKDVADALQREFSISVPHTAILMSDIKTKGEHDVSIVGGGEKATLKVVV